MKILIIGLWGEGQAGGRIEVSSPGHRTSVIEGKVCSGHHIRELEGHPPFKVHAEAGTFVDYMIIDGFGIPAPNRLPTEGQRWMHHTGRLYTILCLARNEMDEVLVIHKGDDGNVWSRTIGNFLGVKNGHPRFTLYSTPAVVEGL